MLHHSSYLSVLTLALLSTFVPLVEVAAQSPPTVVLRAQVVAQGGASSGSPVYRMTASLGQPVAGPAGSASYRAGFGFWHAAFSVPAENRVWGAVDDAYSIQAGETLAVEAPGVLTGDHTTGSPAVSLAVGPFHAADFELSEDGSFSYTPEPGFYGADYFGYAITDAEGNPYAATATISILPESPPGPLIHLGSPSGAGAHTVAVDPSTGHVYVGGGLGTWAENEGGPSIYIDIRVDDLARWDGEGWAAMGSIGPVSVADYLPNHGLVVGGAFDYASEDGKCIEEVGAFRDYGLPKIGRLVGSGECSGLHNYVYAPIGPDQITGGFADYVATLTAGPGGILYAGGDAVIEGHVAAWDGQSWQALGGGVQDGYVTAMAVDTSTGDLYIAGPFSRVAQPGGSILESPGVARWDGTRWHSLGGGCNWCDLNALAVTEDGTVYVGGHVRTMINPGGEEVAVRCVARWDGAAWKPLGEGLNCGGYWGVSALEAYGEDIFVGGSFDEAYQADGETVPGVQGIARWEARSQQWSTVGEGVTPGATVRDITLLERPESDAGLLYFVSDFDGLFYAEVQASPAEPSPVEHADLPAAVELEPAYPNPFNPQTTIVFSLPSHMVVRLRVYDVLGREVAVLVDGFRSAGRHEVSFDASGLPSGLYSYRLEAEGFMAVRQATLLK